MEQELNDKLEKIRIDLTEVLALVKRHEHDLYGNGQQGIVRDHVMLMSAYRTWKWVATATIIAAVTEGVSLAYRIMTMVPH